MGQAVAMRAAFLNKWIPGWKTGNPELDEELRQLIHWHVVYITGKDYPTLDLPDQDKIRRDRMTEEAKFHPGSVISQPIEMPVNGPVGCRRGSRPFQGQTLPPCEGKLLTSAATISKMILENRPPSVACPKCRLVHGFLLQNNKVLYGALL